MYPHSITSQQRRDRRSKWRQYREAQGKEGLERMVLRSPLVDNRAKREKESKEQRTFAKHVTGLEEDSPASRTREKEEEFSVEMQLTDIEPAPETPTSPALSTAFPAASRASTASASELSARDDTSDDDSTASLFVTIGDQTTQRLRQFRSTTPRPRGRQRQRRRHFRTQEQRGARRGWGARDQPQQTTRNVRSLETDAISSVHVDEYDYSSRLYTIGLTMVHEDGVHRCRVKLSWTQHVQRALSQVKRKAPKDAFNQFMQDVNRTFSFAPKYKSFKQFLVGRLNSRNHRSVLLVGTVLTYIVNQAKQKDNANFRVCVLLLEKIFGIVN